MAAPELILSEYACLCVGICTTFRALRNPDDSINLQPAIMIEFFRVHLEGLLLGPWNQRLRSREAHTVRRLPKTRTDLIYLARTDVIQRRQYLLVFCIYSRCLQFLQRCCCLKASLQLTVRRTLAMVSHTTVLLPRKALPPSL